nr:[FeFe] hydrogenase H-cluster maturation GTPase HydF [uncultured Merdimonas sp.]
MSLNSTPSSERTHIGIFGKRNAGKSSLINAMTGQSLAIVSDVKGTTTDPVLKSMELLPLGPVVVIDTPGLDDEGELGTLRIQKAYQMLNKTDIAVLVIDGTIGMTQEDARILERIRAKEIPYLIALNKADLVQEKDSVISKMETDYQVDPSSTLWVSASVSDSMDANIYQFKERIASLTPEEEPARPIVGDLIHPSDFVVLVVPIDKAAPKGRLILPQQQTIRDILDSDAVSVVVKENDLKHVLQTLGRKPSLVITDSQVFAKVSADTPDDIPLTSFSILFARYKGNLDILVNGARTVDELADGDTVLISEGCTHHRQCDDIGTVKLPRWIREHTGKQLNFEFTSGTEFPARLDRFRMLIHCGGCMLNEREMKYRIRCAQDAGIPITNYGTAIAYMKGILERSIQIFHR